MRRESLARDVRGSNLVEYVLLLGMVVLLAVSAYKIFGQTVGRKMGSEAEDISAVPGGGHASDEPTRQRAGAASNGTDQATGADPDHSPKEGSRGGARSKTGEQAAVTVAPGQLDSTGLERNSEHSSSWIFVAIVAVVVSVFVLIALIRKKGESST